MPFMIETFIVYSNILIYDYTNFQCADYSNTHVKCVFCTYNYNLPIIE
jgi:hypothetical protein